MDPLTLWEVLAFVAVGLAGFGIGLHFGRMSAMREFGGTVDRLNATYDRSADLLREAYTGVVEENERLREKPGFGHDFS